MAIDPVCLMEVEESTAQWTSEYKGQAYYFCAPGCKVSFEEDPEKYLSGDGADPADSLAADSHATSDHSMHDGHGHAADSHAASDHSMHNGHGHAADGHAASGHDVDKHASGSHSSDGDVAGGYEASGHAADGNAAGGHEANNNAASSNATSDQSSDDHR